MGNPRNSASAASGANSAASVASTKPGLKPVDEWKTFSLGSVAVRDGKNLVRDNDVSFVINARNAEFFRDAAQFILDNPTDAEGKDQRISINAYPFYEGSVSDNMLKYFSHKLCVTKETVEKTGKKIADYVKIA